MSEHEPIKKEEQPNYHELAQSTPYRDLSYIKLDGLEIPGKIARNVMDTLYCYEQIRYSGGYRNRNGRDPKEVDASLDGTIIGINLVMRDLGMFEQSKAVSTKAYFDDLKMKGLQNG